MGSTQPPRKSLERLLRLRNELRRRLPDFYRHQYWKFKKFSRDPCWRKPKGNDNKMRLKLKGYPPVVSIGYRKPTEIRGLHPSGLYPVTVSSLRDLDAFDPSEHIIYISSTVGYRKRQEIIKAALEKGFKIANM